MKLFLDIAHASLNKHGEELCGDKVKVFRNDQKSIIVLSDGLGSGVKANILATLTSEIIINMLRADIPLEDVIYTVINTLPVCKEREVAYATFTAVEVNNTTRRFKIINFDNPAPFYFRHKKNLALDSTTETILGQKVEITEGIFERGDILMLASDGVLFAGVGNVWNFGWGWKNIRDFIEETILFSAPYAKTLVQKLIEKTSGYYGGKAGDDATVVGLRARERHSLMVFTGPPLDESMDDHYAEQVIAFDGRKAVCGGTTGLVMEKYLGEVIDVELSTLRENVPPIGRLSQIDLMTEGIITMSQTLTLIRACNGNISRLPDDHNGAVLLARELLTADSIHFLVGQAISAFYQNPLLPKNLSIRKNLVDEIRDYLVSLGKEVRIETC